MVTVIGILYLIAFVGIFAAPIAILLVFVVPKKYTAVKSRKVRALQLLAVWVVSIIALNALIAFEGTETGKEILAVQEESPKVKEKELADEVKKREENLERLERTYKEKRTMTLDKYNRIQMGMTPKQVHEIVGSLGEVVSQSKVEGYNTVILQFEGNGLPGSNANITIQNDCVVAKAQVGLK